MSVPPELMAALQQAQGGSPDAGYAGLPPEQQGFAGLPPDAGPGQSQGGSPTPEEILNQMVSLCKDYLNAEKDPGQLAKMTAVLDEIMQNLAKEQQEMHAALGGKVSPRLMAQNLG